MPELRVVSYNVHTLRDDVAALAAVVRDLAPDVLVVQEAPRRFRWRARCARLAHDLDLVYAAGGLPSLGNVILTNLRVRVHDTRCLQFPLTPGRHMRGAVFARCSVARVPFAVAGSHLSTDPTERPAQAILLTEALSGWLGRATPPGPPDRRVAPLVLGVDLNEGPDGAAWRVLSDGMVDSAKAGGAEDFTFPCATPTVRIDALLVDPRIFVRSCQVIDTPQARRASDHLPIVADLALPAAPVTAENGRGDTETGQSATETGQSATSAGRSWRT